MFQSNPYAAAEAAFYRELDEAADLAELEERIGCEILAEVTRRIATHAPWVSRLLADDERAALEIGGIVERASRGENVSAELFESIRWRAENEARAELARQCQAYARTACMDASEPDADSIFAEVVA